MSQLRRLARLIVVSMLPFLAAEAQEADVPGPLEPWRDWVLYGEEFRACPVLNGFPARDVGSHVCAWPGQLTLTVSSTGAQFSQTWTLYREEWVPLPGDGDYWPQNVAVDGGAQPVVARGGRPTLRLSAGTHRVAGELGWVTRPASLEIPREVGLVALRVDEQAIASPQIDGGTLWLGLRPDAEIEEDRLDVVVYRRLDDSLPQRLETVIRLDVAGQSREVALSGAMLAGFVGEALDADLPAQLAPDGMLRAQLRPGRWELRLTARSPALVATLARAAAETPWPADEIWSFEQQSRLRVAALEGAEAVDAERSGVPPEWRHLPGYRVGAGQSVAIVERSRNDAAQPNRLSLRRDLWLDFDGGGFTARDRVRGRMLSRWRLDMAAPYTMTMAAVGGENLLITEGLEPGLQGVELRAENVGLLGTARLERGGALPITGYRERFDDVFTTLHVPPGYRVVAASGADRADGVWLERWRLLDIFLLLIITAAAWRLFGAAAGVIALVALVLTFHEPLAPRWAWLNLFIAIALLRVAPAGRLQSFCRRYRLASVAALVLLLIPFTVGQLRTGLFPQLEHPGLERGVAGYSADTDAFLDTVRSRELASAAAGSREELLELRAAPLQEVVVTAAQRIGGSLSRYQPGALVQTGPGLPDWAWTRYSLGFSGPVEAEQSFRLVMLGPWLVAAWRFASVVLALGLLWLVVGRPTRLPPVLWRGAPASAALALAALLLPPSGHAQTAAEFPAPVLLEELKARLTTPAACDPACAELSTADVVLEDDTLTVALDLASQAPVAVPVPTVARGWRPTSIAIDGTAAGFLFRDRSQTAWLPVEAGVHRVTLTGPLPAATDSLTLPFPMPPRRITVTAPGWDIGGVSEGRLRSGAVELIRQRDDGGGDGELAATVFPPFVNVVRRVEFDVDWGVTTTVERVAPQSGAFTLPVDLLPNEAVITPGIAVAGGRASVAFAAGQDTVMWQSRLPTSASLSLTAPENAARAERWQFAVGYIWHADYAGIPATAPELSEPSFYVPEYYPRPGETLTVQLRRPAAAGGDTIAIDRVDYARNVGARTSESTLGFTYRSTRGAEHAIGLPGASELERVAIDGDDVPLELEDGGRLAIPVTPGEHRVEIAWRDADGARIRAGLPAVDLGGGASNLHATLNLPADRWVLFTYGPTLGPAVLYWPELLAFALAAVVLGRLALSPLRTHEWLLLGFGLSTFAWPVLLLFAVWAFAMSWRGSARLELSRQWFNALQIGLGALTIAAIVALVGAIPFGLLGQPNMQIVSPVEFYSLSWFADRTAGATPSAGAVSVSLWFYKAAMLAWALWLSFALLRWLPWAWRAFSQAGIWRGRAAPAAG